MTKVWFFEYKWNNNKKWVSIDAKGESLIEAQLDASRMIHRKNIGHVMSSLRIRFRHRNFIT